MRPLFIGDADRFTTTAIRVHNTGSRPLGRLPNLLTMHLHGASRRQYFLISRLYCQAHGTFHEHHVLDDDRSLRLFRRESSRKMMMLHRPPALLRIGTLLGIVRLAVSLVALPVK